jgi:hypothetical protein
MDWYSPEFERELFAVDVPEPEAYGFPFAIES